MIRNLNTAPLLAPQPPAPPRETGSRMAKTVGGVVLLVVGVVCGVICIAIFMRGIKAGALIGTVGLGCLFGGGHMLRELYHARPNDEGGKEQIAAFALANGGRWFPAIEPNSLPPFRLTRLISRVVDVVQLPDPWRADIGNITHVDRSYTYGGYVFIPLGYQPPAAVLSPERPSHYTDGDPYVVGSPREAMRYGDIYSYGPKDVPVPQHLLAYVQNFPEKLEVEFAMSAIFVRMRQPVSTSDPRRWVMICQMIMDLRAIAAAETRAAQMR